MSTFNDGEAIRWVRTLRGYSRKALADLSGVSSGRLSSIEVGAPPRPEELAKIWGALTSDPPAAPRPAARASERATR